MVAISIFFFLASLISALYVLQVLNGYNAAFFIALGKILLLTEDTAGKVQNESKKIFDSISKSMKIFHPITDILFLLGVASFLVIALINFI